MKLMIILNDDADDDTNDDTDDDTDYGGRGHLYTIKVPGCCSWVAGSCCLSGCILKNTHILFFGGTVKKTSGAKFVFLGGGGGSEFFNRP